MRAIVIDPVAVAVSETELDCGPSYGDVIAVLKPIIGGEVGIPLDITRDHELWFDDTGLLKSPTRFFAHRVAPHAIAGRGVILGTRGRRPCAAQMSLAAALADLVLMEAVDGRLHRIDPSFRAGYDPFPLGAVPQ